ncbi:MAG: pilus assembly protein MshP [Methylomonas sp.]|nr:MAG: pilus assembly protein MshP [Methylomonas sp.]
MIKQQGFSLVMAIFILVVVGLLGGYMLRLGGVQLSTFNQTLQGAKAYQAARAGIEWGIARISNGGSCADISAQTAMSFTGLQGFSVRMICSSQTFSEADRNLTVFRLSALSQFGDYTNSEYTARQLEVTMVR